MKEYTAFVCISEEEPTASIKYTASSIDDAMDMAVADYGIEAVVGVSE
jgi:hypothetical protein